MENYSSSKEAQYLTMGMGEKMFQNVVLSFRREVYILIDEKLTKKSLGKVKIWINNV